MKSYNSALKKLKKNCLFIQNETISTRKALNRVSALDIFSKIIYPSSDNTAFDGFAVNSKETILLKNEKIKKFKIIKTLSAGENPKISKVNKNSSIEVMTGAIIKKPFDTVIPIEKVQFYPNNKKPKYIIIDKKIKNGEFIRKAGSDYKIGD